MFWFKIKTTKDNESSFDGTRQISTLNLTIEIFSSKESDINISIFLTYTNSDSILRIVSLVRAVGEGNLLLLIPGIKSLGSTNKKHGT